MNAFVEAFKKSSGPQNFKAALILWLKGVCMGIADLIPGVSGGTIAFIMGIYDDLLDAMSSLNRENIAYLMRFEITKFIGAFPTKFSLVLMLGIMTSILLFARVMHYLITEQALFTWSFFFGLIMASVPIMWRQIPSKSNTQSFFYASLGAATCYFIVGLIPVETPTTWWFIILCGFIGITAMILPGLSGSFLLIMLGKYEYITSAIKDITQLSNLITLGFFSIGTLTGLMTFSKLLKSLLAKYRMQTMAFLTGILVGSLRKVWPWKEVLESKMIRGKLRTLREINIIPSPYNNQFWICLLLMILGLFLVLLLESRSRSNHS